VPFTGDTPVEIAMKHLSQVPEPPSALRKDVPHDLDAIVMRALAKDPEHRYGSAEEMDADLARVARGVAISRETEDAMTQVLSGAGAAGAQTIVQRPSRAVTPPAPPVYRTPTPFYDYEEPPPGRSVWPWLLALGLIIAGGIGGWFLYTKIQDQLNNNKLVSIPDVMLLQKGLARDHVQQAGFTPRIVFAASETVPKGQVADEQPAGGSKFVKGTTVTLTISTGKPKVKVPDVVGIDQTSAITQLVNAGLQPKVHSVYSNVQSGNVTAEQPHAGDTVVTGTVVHINVSRGPKPIQLPDVTGQQFLNAQSALKGLGFKVTRNDVQSDKPKGQVVAEDPQPGSPEPAGTTITLSVSQGPTTTQVPDVTGMNQADAESTLTGAGFTPNVVDDPVSDPGSDGIVIDEDPKPNSKAKQGSTVTIHVGQLTVGTDTTTTTGNPSSQLVP
jgi:serine/threonine-protein kinase